MLVFCRTEQQLSERVDLQERRNMMLTSVFRRVAARSSWFRHFGLKPSERFLREEPFPPNYSIESIKPPDDLFKNPPPDKLHPMAYVRNPVTSAHMIDLSKPGISARDSAALTPSGTVLHGRYGDLGVIDGIPLEYLALLRPASEGAAALRVISSLGKKGTVVVFGASQANGLAATQLLASSGNAVVAVVGGEHSGVDELMDTVKGLCPEPGCSVPEELAKVKKNFADIVEACIEGDKMDVVDPDQYLKDFKQNLLAYAAAYPDTRPAALNQSHIEFAGKEEDRENFRANMDAYLQQYMGGSPPMDPAKVDRYFTNDQYAALKPKFNKQLAAVVTGDKVGEFNPAQIVSDMIQSPEEKPNFLSDYEFSPARKDLGVETLVGGPMVGAVIAITPDLREASMAMAKAGDSLRAKAEALQFLTRAERNAFAAATSVTGLAKKHGVPVYVIGGSLPGLESVEPNEEDVQEALAAMDIDEDGSSRLNYFVHVYRAGDFPFYADYAVHRATEELPGPRQIIVTK